MRLVDAVASGAITRALVLADDLTGASATASRLVATGADVALLTWPPAESWNRDLPARVTVIDTHTRAKGEGEARRRLARIVRELDDDVAVSLRVDTTLRGHLAASVKTVREELEARRGPQRVLAAPAYPSAGRTTIAGRQCLRDGHGRSRQISRDSLGRELGLRGNSLRIASSHAPLGGDSDVVLDAEQEHDFAVAARRMANADGRPWLVVDAGSFLPHLLVAAGLATGPATVLLVRGSRADCTRAQTDMAHQLLGGTRVSVDPNDPRSSMTKLSTTLDGDPPLATIEPDGAVHADEGQVVSSLAVVARHAIERGVRQIILTGGHTAAGVLQELGVRRLRPLIEPFALGAVGSVVGGDHDGVLVLTKGGQVGHDTALVDAVTLLQGMVAVASPAEHHRGAESKPDPARSTVPRS